MTHSLVKPPHCLSGLISCCSQPLEFRRLEVTKVMSDATGVIQLAQGSESNIKEAAESRGPRFEPPSAMFSPALVAARRA